MTPRYSGGALLVIVLVACDCDDPRFDLPSSDREARALIERETLRPPQEPAALDAARIVAAVERAIEADALVIGEDAIAEAIDALDARFVVFGVWHDSGDQVRIARRVSRSDVALELVTAPQLFTGFDESREASLLAEFMDTGAPKTLSAFRAELEQRNYTAWKYGYLDEIADLALDARATNRKIVGCDVTSDVMTALERFEPDTRLRLREIHCARTLARSLGDSRRVSLIYGDAHAGGAGLPRFLPDPSRAIHVFGGRAGEAGIEAELARSIGVTEPVLVPIDDELVLLLPDRHLGIFVDRRREEASGPPRIAAFADRAATLWIERSSHAIGETEIAIPIEPGARAAAFRTDRWLIFRVEVRSGTTEVELHGSEIRTLVR
jgi:hypothetical protein